MSMRDVVKCEEKRIKNLKTFPISRLFHWRTFYGRNRVLESFVCLLLQLVASCMCMRKMVNCECGNMRKSYIFSKPKIHIHQLRVNVNIILWITQRQFFTLLFRTSCDWEIPRRCRSHRITSYTLHVVRLSFVGNFSMREKEPFSSLLTCQKLVARKI